MRYEDKLPEQLRDPVRDAFAQWWVLEQGHPPLPDETEVFEGCREHFLSGAALCISALYGDGMRQRKVAALERDAFFAGHAWRLDQPAEWLAPGGELDGVRQNPTDAAAMTCHACGKAIPQGELFTTLSLSREREREGAMDVIHSELLRVECSDCSAFRGCFEEAVEDDIRRTAVRQLLADTVLADGELP